MPDQRDKVLKQFDKDYGPFSADMLAGVGAAYDQLINSAGGGIFVGQPAKNVAKAIACGLLGAHLREYVKHSQQQ